ncbi:MAG: hypothetical protein ACXVXY_13020, partial [Mycobacteriaceae bacterium]
MKGNIAGNGKSKTKRCGPHIGTDLRANAGHRRNGKDEKRSDDDPVDHFAMGRQHRGRMPANQKRHALGAADQQRQTQRKL